MPFPPLSLSPNAVAAANEAKMQLISGGGELRAVVIKSRYKQQSTFIRRRRIIERQVSSFVVGPQARVLRRSVASLGAFSLAARTNVTLNK